MSFGTPSPLHLPAGWYQVDVPEPVCFLSTEFNLYQYNVQTPFCEGLVYRHQYLNCLTDFWILGMSFWQLTWDHNHPMMRWAAATFGVNAVGSFFNHWYGTRVWFVMDNSSMYVLIWIVIGGVWDTTFRYNRVFQRKQKQSEEKHSARGCCQNDPGRVLIKSSLWVFCASMQWICLMNDMAGCHIGGGSVIFLLGVMPPLLSLLVNWWYFGHQPELDEEAKALETRQKHRWREGSFLRSKQYMKWGVGVSLFCAGVWILIETILCPINEYKVGKVVGYIPGHAVWHLGMSYGLALVSIWFITMESVLQKSHYFAYKTIEERIFKCPGESDSRCNRCLDCMFPVITNNRNIKHVAGQSEERVAEMSKTEDGLSAEL